jgi:hypothetical protein
MEKYDIIEERRREIILFAEGLDWWELLFSEEIIKKRLKEIPIHTIKIRND